MCILGPPYCGIGATLRIGREIWCLPYAGFLNYIHGEKNNKTERKQFGGEALWEAWNWLCDLRTNERPRKRCPSWHRHTNIWTWRLYNWIGQWKLHNNARNYWTFHRSAPIKSSPDWTVWPFECFWGNTLVTFALCVEVTWQCTLSLSLSVWPRTHCAPFPLRGRKVENFCVLNFLNNKKCVNSNFAKIKKKLGRLKLWNALDPKQLGLESWKIHIMKWTF